MNAGDGVRLDKWLWAARFFRSRSLATDAVKAGHVTCNGARAKPGRVVHVGDRLVVRKAGQDFELEVRALSERRGAASQAQTLYLESEQSIDRREQAAAQRRAERLSAPRAPESRPDKHARRQIRKLIGR